MVTVLDDKVRKARKDHVCDLCGGKIHKGEMYNRFEGVDDVPYSFKTHLDCMTVCKNLIRYFDWEDEDEGYNHRIFDEAIGEYAVVFHKEDWADKDIFRGKTLHECVQMIIADNYEERLASRP